MLEHLPRADATELVRRYLPALRPGGTVILITPQERGYRSDPTHVTYLDLDALAELAADAGLTPTRRASFPFPRAAGRLFPYNEFVLVATRP